LTGVRVVCQNTLTGALGGSMDGSKAKGAFRMSHSQAFDANMKAQAEAALGLAHEGIKEYSHTAQLLAGVKAKDEMVTDFFHGVLQLEHDEEAVVTEAELIDFEENRNMKKFRHALTHQPGAEMSRGTWWSAFNAVTYTVDHVLSTDENRLFSAWHGNGANMKRRALNLAVEFAKAA